MVMDTNWPILLNHAVNLIYHVGCMRNIEAVDNIIEGLSAVCNEDQLGLILTETAEYIAEVDPDLMHWFTSEIIEFIDDDPSDTLNDLLSSDYQTEYIDSVDILHILLDEGFKRGRDFTYRSGVISIKNKRTEVYLLDTLNIACQYQ